jgi:hypothetical protein
MPALKRKIRLFARLINQPRAWKEVLLFGVASTPRAWGDPRWQSQGICIASLASQEEEEEEERAKVLKKTSRKGKDLSRGQGDERTLEKRMLLI